MAKRNKKRPSKQITCTCTLRYDLDPPKYIDHEAICDLWYLDDFASGVLDWDPVAQKLVVMYGDGSGWDGDDVLAGESTDLQRIIDATVGGMAAMPGNGRWSNYVSCRHNMTEVRLPDGTVVHCSASTDCRGRVNRPDYAVYLYGGWSASSVATFIPWEDYGTPFVPWRAAREVVEEFYRRALAGQRVEVGCMGGHGRTGTFLAAVVMLADPNMTAKGAVAWVRSNYCTKAVEDASQEYWLKWFADPTLPAFYSRPKPPVKAAAAVGTGTSCERSKKGRWCNKDQGHAGPHHYTLAGRREAAPVAVVATPCELPDHARCERLLDVGVEGTWRCVGGKSHAGNHSYRKAEGAVPCDKGMSGPCSLVTGHGGACVVRQTVMSK